MLAEFARHDTVLLLKFVQLFMPIPQSGKHKFFSVRSSLGHKVEVWGDSEIDVMNKFERFLNMRAFL